jgi:RNAse (barnase) inhibitor barstar
MEFTLNFDNISTQEDLHDMLSNELKLPDYYGRNMDAFEEVLRDKLIDNENKAVTVTVVGHVKGKYEDQDIVVETLLDNEKSHSNLKVVFA